MGQEKFGVNDVKRKLACKPHCIHNIIFIFPQFTYQNLTDVTITRGSFYFNYFLYVALFSRFKKSLGQLHFKRHIILSVILIEDIFLI